MCLRKARRGGLSCVANAVTIYNELVRTRPDLAESLFQPLPYDLRGEQAPGAKPSIRSRSSPSTGTASSSASSRPISAPRSATTKRASHAARASRRSTRSSAMARDPRLQRVHGSAARRDAVHHNYHVLPGARLTRMGAATSATSSGCGLRRITSRTGPRISARMSITTGRRTARSARYRLNMPWNYGDLLEAVSNTVAPDAPAFAHGETVTSWGEAKPAHEQSRPRAHRARRRARRQDCVLSAQLSRIHREPRRVFPWRG